MATDRGDNEEIPRDLNLEGDLPRCDNEEIPLDLNLQGDPLLKTLGSGGEAPPRRPKSENLPFKTVGSEREGAAKENKK